MKITLPENRARIEMLPLIDVVFLLLVVFIFAMLSMAVHKGMPVTLPDSSAAGLEKKLTLSVSIDAQGQIFVNREKTDLDGLVSRLEAEARAAEERSETETRGVLIFADRATAYQDLFRVLDRIRQAGLERISLQADPESPASDPGK